MDDELEYLTWLAIRNNEFPSKRTYYYPSGFRFGVPASLYEDWITTLSKEMYSNRNYHIARLLESQDTTPKSRYIPWLSGLPKKVIPDCKAILMSEITWEDVKPFWIKSQEEMRALS